VGVGQTVEMNESEVSTQLSSIERPISETLPTDTELQVVTSPAAPCVIPIPVDQGYETALQHLPPHPHLSNETLMYIVQWLGGSCTDACHSTSESICAEVTTASTPRLLADSETPLPTKVLVSDTDSDSEKSFSLLRTKARNRILKKLRRS
jgi:hypothetical protein